MLKKLSFYIFAFGFSFNTLSTSLPNREITILLETLDAESINYTLKSSNNYLIAEGLKPSGLGAITITMLIALYQQTSPIIANKSLIKNIVDHQNVLSDFLRLDCQALYHKYGNNKRFKDLSIISKFKAHYQYINSSFNEINKELKSLLTNPQKNIEQILEKIISDKKFNINHYPASLYNLNSNNISVPMLYLETTLYILCSLIDFNDWQVKQVNEDIFLLLPKNYIKRLNLTIPVIDKPLKQERSTALELKLGLKVDHMKNVERSFFELNPNISNKYIYFTKSLEQIFITKNDIKKSKIQNAHNNIWSLYMTGHGLSRSLQVEVLPQLYSLKNLLNKKLSIIKDYDINEKHQKQIERVNFEIKKSEEIIASLNKEYLGVICSLSINEFKDVLKFFNNNIETSLLYYTSCFGGGMNLHEPYIENGKPLLLNFPIISGTPAENMSVQECPFINLPPYTKENKQKTFTQTFNLKANDIDIVHKKLELVTTLQFGQFFLAARKGYHHNLDKLILLPYSLHPHIDSQGKALPQFIPNIPLIRFAHADHFQPIPNDNSMAILDTKSNNGIKIINDAVLIYTDFIPSKITLNILDNQLAPKLFSMAPGFALHVLEEINSSTLNLNEIINSFLTFPELGSSKIFWIKKLECKNAANSKCTEIFKNVIIMRNVLNSAAIEKSSNKQSVRLENCAYFSTNGNQESKLIWDGAFIERNNYTITSWYENQHKEECINCFPQAKNFLNPILQGI